MQFVNIHHPDTGQHAEVPQTAVKHHLGKGWVEDGPPEPEPVPDSAPRVRDIDTESTTVDVTPYHTGNGWYEVNGERYHGQDEAVKALVTR